MDSGFSQDLDAWLESMTDDRYVVDRTLKSTPAEITEVVWRRSGINEQLLGPFVRKTIRNPEERGGAYQHILQAQASGIRFDHLPIVYECEYRDDTLLVVMEYIDGQTLQEHVERYGPSEELALYVALELCDALTELHESFDNPIVHRDVKPANVMVTGERLLLIDLGIARDWHEGATRDTRRYGTPGYAPPEQFGYGQTSVRSDLFALGMTCVFCLTGSDPDASLVERCFEDERIPKRWRTVLSVACAFDPSARYQTTSELKSALATLVSPPRTMPTQWRQRQGKGQSFRVPDVIGTIWNIILLLTDALIVVVSWNMAMKPSESFVDYPLLLRTLMAIAMPLAPVLGISFLLLDKRRLRRHFEPMAQLTLRQQLFWSLLVPLALIALALIFLIIYLSIR